MKTLKGTLVYVQVQHPVDCFDKAKGQEWKSSIVVDEDTADAWNEEYNKQQAIAVKTSEFFEKYKIEPPYPDAKKQYVITVRKNTKLGNGEPVPEIYQPKVFLQEGNTRRDITKDVLVANGSKGYISVDTWEMSKGKVARLRNVLVTDLIEYVKEEGSESKPYEPGDEFDELQVKSSTALQTQVKSSTAPQTSKTGTAAAKRVEKKEDDDDPPF
jgi:hypothetical protein